MTLGKKRRSAGFTLMELLISMALLLVISSTAFSAMNGFSRTYSTTMTMADMDSGLRNAAELITQEVGQAGNVPYSSQNLGGAVVGSTIPQTVTLTSATNMYVGQMLQVDSGAAQENVQITAIPSATTVTGKFVNSHAAAAPQIKRARVTRLRPARGAPPVRRRRRPLRRAPRQYARRAAARSG